MSGKITIVQGGQYGSEGKGQVAAWLATGQGPGSDLVPQRGYDIAVRTGSINAGHTVISKGHTFKMQQIPTAFVNPNCQLVIGPGAYIHLDTLEREIAEIKEFTGEDVRQRLLIDHRCTLHLDQEEMVAKESGREYLIGATGKGCAEAIIRKISQRNTDNEPLQFGALAALGVGLQVETIDVPAMLNDAYDRGARILIEGTQGQLLDLHQGPYPYVTSRMTTPANWIAESGLSPAMDIETALVFRTFPIRVAGNSGPLPYETCWTVLAADWGVDYRLLQRWNDAVQRVGEARGCHDLQLHHTWPQGDTRRTVHAKVLRDYSIGAMELIGADDREELSRIFEFTTVTKRLRRIARFNIPLAKDVIWRERPSMVVLTFWNYLDPASGGDPTLIRSEWIETWKKVLPGLGAVSTGPGTDEIYLV